MTKPGTFTLTITMGAGEANAERIVYHLKATIAAIERYGLSHAPSEFFECGTKTAGSYEYREAEED